MQLLLVDLGDILAVEQDLSTSAFQQMNHGSAQGGLAAAGLADNAHSGAPLNGEGHIVHSVQLSTGGIKIFHEVFCLNQRCICHSV